MKTTPQPVIETAAKAEAKAVSRPVRRMRSKGPLQRDDLHKSPNPGGDPPYDHAGGDRLADQDARGSGGVPSPPGLPVRLNPGGPPGDSGDDHGGGGGHDESEENTPVHSDDGAGPPRKPDGDPDPDGPHGKHSRMYQSMTINKWAKPIPKLDLPPRIHTQKASKIKQIWETWCVQVALALSTWNSLAVPYWSDIYGRAERDYEKFQKGQMGAGQMGSPKCAIFDAIFAIAVVLLAPLARRQGHFCNFRSQMAPSTHLMSVDDTPLLLPRRRGVLPLLNRVEVRE